MRKPSGKFSHAAIDQSLCSEWRGDLCRMWGNAVFDRRLRDFDGTLYDMVGIIPAEAVMGRTHMTLGYRELTIKQPNPIGSEGMRIRGHEFHYSTLQPKQDLQYVGQLVDAQGRDRGYDGILIGNVTAFYTHLHFSTCPQIPAALLQAARSHNSLPPQQERLSGDAHIS